LERIWKEEVMAIFEVLSRYLPEETEENHNLVPIATILADIPTGHFREYKSESLPLEPARPLTIAVG
jgi:hypothetical protein